MLRRCLSFVVLVTLSGCHSAKKDHAGQIAEFVREQDFASLLKLTDHEDAQVRNHAAEAFAWSLSPKATPGHKKILADERIDWRERTAAAWRLMEADAPGAMDAVLQALKSPTVDVRRNMANLLGRLQPKGALVHLEACKADNDKFVAAWCEWGRCRIKREAGCKKPNMNLTNGKPAP